MVPSRTTEEDTFFLFFLPLVEACLLFPLPSVSLNIAHRGIPPLCNNWIPTCQQYCRLSCLYLASSSYETRGITHKLLPAKPFVGCEHRYKSCAKRVTLAIEEKKTLRERAHYTLILIRAQYLCLVTLHMGLHLEASFGNVLTPRTRDRKQCREMRSNFVHSRWRISFGPFREQGSNMAPLLWIHFLHRIRCF